MKKTSIKAGFVRGVAAGLSDYHRKSGRVIRLDKYRRSTRTKSVDIKSVVRKVASYQGLLVGFLLPGIVQQMVFDHAVNKALASERLNAFLESLSLRFNKGGKQ